MSVIKIIVATDEDLAREKLTDAFTYGDYKSKTILHEGSHHETKLRVFDNSTPSVIGRTSIDHDAWHKDKNEELYIIVAEFS